MDALSNLTVKVLNAPWHRQTIDVQVTDVRAVIQACGLLRHALRVMRSVVDDNGTLLIKPEASQAFPVDDGEKVETILQYVDRVIAATAE